ncbi:hypothetical protein TNIN_408831, partial [Trichonephila inaurata madagascariensis]
MATLVKSKRCDEKSITYIYWGKCILQLTKLLKLANTFPWTRAPGRNHHRDDDVFRGLAIVVSSSERYQLLSADFQLLQIREIPQLCFQQNFSCRIMDEEMRKGEEICKELLEAYFRRIREDMQRVRWANPFPVGPAPA